MTLLFALGAFSVWQGLGCNQTLQNNSQVQWLPMEGCRGVGMSRSQVLRRGELRLQQAALSAESFVLLLSSK